MSRPYPLWILHKISLLSREQVGLLALLYFFIFLNKAAQILIKFKKNDELWVSDVSAKVKKSIFSLYF